MTLLYTTSKHWVNVIVIGRHPIKVRNQHREELTLMHAPRSLFDRPSPAMVKMRHDLRLHKFRGGSRPVLSVPTSPLAGGLKPVPPTPEPDHVPEWTIYEDWAILQVVQIKVVKVNLITQVR